MQNLCFWPEFTISRYRTCENGFATKSTILPHWTTKDVSECFGAFCKPLEHKMMQNLCFCPEFTILGNRTSENGFARKSTILPHWIQTMFESVSEHFANLLDIKRCKTYVSSLNAIFQATELGKMVSQRNLPFYPIRPKTMFECVSDHFANLSGVKWCITCLFWPKFTISRYRTSEKNLATNAPNLLH